MEDRSPLTATLIETYRPEFAAALGRDLLLTNHREVPGEFAEAYYARLVGFRTALRQRRLQRQGAERQRGLLRGYRELAEALARRIPVEAEHLLIDANLLPHLHCLGALGGRSYDVLLSRLPYTELHRVLDHASAQHPERGTLADFRAPGELVEAEAEALAGARRIITAHAIVAETFGPRACLVDWPKPTPLPWNPGESIVFPGPAVARKGAFEAREVARRLYRPVRLLGRTLEDDGFWTGIEVRPSTENWLDGAGVVVQPAWIEERPHRLLSALAAGCPVVATRNCGLLPQPGLTLVPPGDVEALAAAVRAAFETSGRR